MEPDTERAIAGSPRPPIDESLEKHHSIHTSSLSSQTEGQNGQDTLSVHSAVPSTVKDADETKNEKDPELAQAVSTSSENPPPMKVPRSKRRGLFARFTVLAEVEEPKHYGRGTKWLITFIIALAAVAAPLGSAIILRMHVYTSQSRKRHSAHTA